MELLAIQESDGLKEEPFAEPGSAEPYAALYLAGGQSLDKGGWLDGSEVPIIFSAVIVPLCRGKDGRG